MLRSYLNFLQESYIITKNGNAPCVAFEIVYKKKCPHERGMDPSHVKRIWKEIQVDKHLKDEWLNDLNNIKDIEMRSSCEGHDQNWVAFIIFRFINPLIENDSIKLNKLIKNLESDNFTKCGFEIGREKKIRFIVAAKTWYGDKNWEKWWSTLSKKLKKSLNEI